MDIGTIEGTIKLNSAALTEAADRFTQFGNKSTSIASQIAQDADRVEKNYNKLAASISPVIAAEQKLEAATKTLDAALQKGLITHQKHNQLLAAAKEKFEGAGHSAGGFTSLISKLNEVAGLGGKAVEEITSKLGGMTSQIGSAGAALAELGALAPVIAGLAVVLGGLAIGFEAFSFLKEAIVEGMKTQVVIEQLNASLKSNGAAAGYSAHELVAQAEALVDVTGRSKDAIIQGEIILTRFDKIGRDVFPQARKAALDYAQATGKDLKESFTLIGRAYVDAGKSLNALKEIGVRFSADQKKALTDMVDHGKLIEYQSKLTEILKEKTGEAAAAYAGSLAGGIAISKEKLSLFKESIASEVIPALEFLGSELLKSAGGWDNVTKKVKQAGEWIGNFVREMVFSVIMDFEEQGIAADRAALNLNESWTSIGDGILNFVTFCIKSWASLPAIFGGGDDSGMVAALQRTKAKFDANMAAEKKSIADSMTAEGAAWQRAAAALQEHKKALEGNEVVENRILSTVDKVAGKNKDVKDALDGAARAAQEYANKLSDVEVKLQEKIDSQDRLVTALGYGEAAYNRQKLAEERQAEIDREVTEVTKAHRAEIEKLQEAQKKLIEQHKVTDAARVGDQIKAENAAYGDQVDKVTELADRSVALKQVVASRLLTLQQERAFTDQLRQAEAELADAQADLKLGFVHSTAAIRENAIALEVEKELLSKNAIVGLPFAAALEATVRARHKSTDSIHEETSATRVILDLNRQQQKIFEDQAVAGDSMLRSRLELERQIRAQIEALPKTLDSSTFDQLAARIRASLERAFTWQQYFDKAYAPLKQLGDGIASGFANIVSNFVKTGEIKFSDFTATIRESFANAIGSMVQEWLTKWLEAMAAWLARWIATQAAAKAAQASLGTGSSGFSMGVNPGTSFSPGVGAGAGGAIGTGGSSTTTALIGNPMTSGVGALGGALIVVGAFAAVYFGITQWLKSSKREWASLTISSNDSAQLTLNQIKGAGRAYGQMETVALGIIKTIQDFIKNIGGSFQGMQGDIGITSIGKGQKKDVIVYASGIVTHFGKDLQAALEFATIQAIRQSKIIGLNPILAEAIKNSTAKTMQEFQDQVTKAEDLATVGLTQTGSAWEKAVTDFAARINNIMTLLTSGSSAWTNALQRVTQEFNDSVWGSYYTLTGKKPDEQAQAERLRIEYNAERAMAEIRLTAIQAELMAEISVSNTRHQLTRRYLDDAEIMVAATGLTDDAIKAMIANIQRLIDGLPPEIAPGGVVIPGTGGSGRGTSGVDRAAFDKQLKDLASGGLTSVMKALYDYQKQLADLAEQQKKAKAPAADYAAAIAAITKQFQAGLLATAQGYAGIDDSFVKRLQDGLQFFKDLEEMGRKKSGIPNWLERILKGEFLDSMRLDWQARVDAFAGLTNPMSAITAQADQLQKQLEALAAATGMSAEQIAAGRAEIQRGVEYQRQTGINGILDKLFGYLQNSAKYAGDAVKLKKQEVDLEFLVIRAQLAGYGVLAQYQGLVDDAYKAALDAAGQVTNAMGNVAQAVDNSAAALSAAATQLQGVVKTWEDYQTSLRTNSTLGLVNSRQGLDNSQTIYEETRRKALGGDITAQEGFKSAAETYRINLLAFSPSAELARSAIKGIDDTLTELITKFKVQDPVVAGLSNVVSAIDGAGYAWIEHTDILAAQATKTNDLLGVGLDPLSIRVGSVTDAQDKTTAEIKDLHADIVTLGGALLAWRSDAGKKTDQIITNQVDDTHETSQLVSLLNRYFAGRGVA